MSDTPKGGAPLHNVNAAVHGGRSARPSLALGAWGKRFGNLRAQATRYRRRLTSACRERHGLVSVRHEELILHAARLEMASRVCQKLLADMDDTPSAADQAALVRQVVQYSTARELAVRKLRLADDTPADPWSEVDKLLQQDQTGHDDAGEVDGADDSEHDQADDRPGDGDVESQAGDGEDGAVDWSAVDGLPHPAFE